MRTRIDEIVSTLNNSYNDTTTLCNVVQVWNYCKWNRSGERRKYSSDSIVSPRVVLVFVSEIRESPPPSKTPLVRPENRFPRQIIYKLYIIYILRNCCGRANRPTERCVRKRITVGSVGLTHLRSKYSLEFATFVIPPLETIYFALPVFVIGRCLNAFVPRTTATFL